MSVIFIMIPVALLLAGAAAVAFGRSVLSGQYDDLSGPAVRMLDDDVSDVTPPNCP